MILVGAAGPPFLGVAHDLRAAHRSCIAVIGGAVGGALVGTGSALGWTRWHAAGA